ncbi:MAG: RsmE family RNA methyltransferase [Desulfosoma sp.]
MTRRRFFCESLDRPGKTLTLDADVSHHLWRVLRHREGEAVELCDGRGRTARATIRGHRQGRVEVELLSVTREEPDDVWTVFMVPWARSDRMDLVVRQAVELGVSELWFFEAERSRYALEGSRKDKRLGRYEKIARDALCQSGRAWIPEIRGEDSTEGVLGRLGREPPGEKEIRILASETEPRESLLAVWRRYPQPRRIVSAVGPEGGWTEGERRMFHACGFVPVSLGRHVLRFETACTALLAAVEVLWKQAFHPEFQPAARMETP